MDRTGAYQRVYWTGAAFALEADRFIREASGGDETLLSVLAREQSGWARRLRPMRRGELLAVLDPSGALGRLGEQYASSHRFPDARLRDQGATLADIMRRDEAACALIDGP